MKLTHQESVVLRLRFGLDDGIEREYGEIAEVLDASVTMVQQWEKRAIRKLRHPANRPLLDRIRETLSQMERDEAFMQSVAQPSGGRA
ncbi:sigma factor-like helix-turn-helix DNA-binding protein [Hydrogenimonas sp.]